MTDHLLVQIVNAKGTVARLPGGSPLETDLIQTITDEIMRRSASTFFEALGAGLKSDLVDAATEAIAQKGVGFFKTEAQVRAAITTGLADVLDLAVRAQRTKQALNTYVTHGELRQAIEDGVRAAIQGLKDQTKYVVGPR